MAENHPIVDMESIGPHICALKQKERLVDDIDIE
jgi:hypothetical protein